MVFSGTAVVDKNNTSGLCEGKDSHVAIYTSHVHKNNQGLNNTKVWRSAMTKEEPDSDMIRTRFSIFNATIFATQKCFGMSHNRNG